MIKEIKQLSNEELAEIAEVSYLHEFENAVKLLGHIGYLIGEVERLQYERGLLKLTLHTEIQKENKELQKALEEVKTSVYNIDTIIGVAVGCGEELDYRILSSELKRIENVAGVALERSGTK
jgi:hypothetical protein